MGRTLVQLPQQPSGAIWNPERGFVSVIIATERTNLITNGSFETNVTSWTLANGASIARSTTESYHGAYSLAITPVATTFGGAYYGTVSLTSGTTYAASCKLKGIPGVPYRIAFASTAPVALAEYYFTGTGRFQWVWVYWTETSSTTRRIYITKGNSASTGVFYVDGVQVEAISAGETVSTYLDGDQQPLLVNQFPAPYRWNGTPHASTSTRLATTRAGGMIVNLDRYRYKILAYAGLGLAGVANIAAVSAGADGAQYQGTTVQTRQFALNGFFDAETPFALDRFRSDLYSAIGPDSASPRQPCVLFYQAYDGYDEAGSMGRIVASYQSGLEQKASVVPSETAPITFTQWLPGILANDAGAALATSSTVANANYVVRRAADGTWSALSTGGAGGSTVLAIAEGLDGLIYVGGEFTSMGGVANTTGIAAWNPVTGAWSALSTGTNGMIRALAVAPNGDVYAGGAFTTAGATSADNIARWDGSAWNVVGSATAMSDEVYSIAIDATGKVYAGGIFLNAGGDANADRLAVWNGSAWAAVGATAINAVVRTIAIGMNGTDIYIGGDFTNAGAVANADGVARYDGSWSALSTGLAAGAITRLHIDRRNGLLYAGGNFTAIGGVTASRIAKWNGTGWATLGDGVDGTVEELRVLADGSLAVGGAFTTAGGVTLPDQVALWNGSTWVALDVDLPGTATVYAAYQTMDGAIYLGYNQTGSATAAGVTSLTNNGTARAFPIITVRGPSSGSTRIYRITNTTTGNLLYLNLTINAGETVTITTSSRGTSITSSFRGDIPGVILPGSNPDLGLVPGVNKLAFLTTSATVTALAQWTVSYQSVSDLID